MCGIAGIYSFKEIAEDNSAKEKILKAIETMRLRGPDNKGLWEDEKKRVFLGHARLSIIDTSIKANQPFVDDTGKHVIVFNGEIFNYKELARKLLSEGIKLQTSSDTEVLLHLLIRYGAKAIPMLNGFFALACYNSISGELIIARDRYGLKPLYFKCDETGLCFASELKALKLLEKNLVLNKEILPVYFHLNYIPAPYTIYKNVEKVIPGTYLSVSANGIERTTYYHLADTFNHHFPSTYEDAKTQLQTTLTDAVNKRLISDVPLGTFLSGGVDSSIITALAAKEIKNLNTFSIGFADEPFFDETEYALAVAKKHQTNHHVFKLKNKDLFDQLFNVLNYIDEPFADSSALAVYALSQQTKNKVTVALSGDGADELFAGYNKHSAEFKVRNDGLLNKAIHAGIPLLKKLPASRNSSLLNKVRQVKKYGEILKLTAAERYWRMAGYYKNGETDELILNSSATLKNQLLAQIDSVIMNDEYNSFLQMDQQLVLEGDMLVKVDRMSMANSLEIRSPFLDYRVVDLTNSFPASFKIDSKRRKKILIDTFSHLLPEEILNRKKQGFEVPLLKWFKTELASYIFDDLVHPDFIQSQGLFNFSFIQRLKSQLYSSSPEDSVAKLWALVVFQHWYKQTYCK